MLYGVNMSWVEVSAAVPKADHSMAQHIPSSRFCCTSGSVSLCWRFHSLSSNFPAIAGPGQRGWTPPRIHSVAAWRCIACQSLKISLEQFCPLIFPNTCHETLMIRRDHRRGHSARGDFIALASWRYRSPKIWGEETMVFGGDAIRKYVSC